MTHLSVNLMSAFTDSGHSDQGNLGKMRGRLRPIADLQVIPRERLNTPLERLVKRKDLTMGPLVKNEQAVGVLQE